ncbi:MAG: SH3 domain-containing protein [Enterocloster asparagiformis]|nr:SH3 domain-containing protein [Enterocloster asparagiformis]
MKEKKRGCGCAVTAVIVVLILLTAGALVGWYLLGKYKPSNELADKGKLFGIKSGQVALVLDNELQDTKGIYEDNQVYLPVGWVNEYLNQRFYWDENEELLVYALPESIVYADAQTMGNSGPLLKVKEDGAYLSLGLVANYTDIRTESFDTSQIKRVFIDTLWNPVPKAQAKRAGKLRTKGGVKSPIVTEVDKGDQLTVLEAMEKWSKVRTADGYMGYIENRRLEEQEAETPVSTFEAPVYTSISLDEPVILAFHQVFSQEANNKFEELIADAKGVNVVVPSWFVMTDNKGNYSSIASRDYVEKAHARGIQVWAMLNNVSTKESAAINTKELMGSTSNRKKLIASLMEDADTYGFDGINLDFESLKAEAGPHYVQFIRELSVACRGKGLVLSVDNYVPSAYTNFYNRREQGTVADYVIIMGYDEHYAGGEAGSVASITYVENGIKDTLTQVPKEKVINGVPFYTRVWTVQGGKTTSKAYGISDAKQWVEDNQAQLIWDEALGQYYAEVINADGEQYIWMEEETSLGLKIDLIREYDLAGVACWKLGFEPADIWDVVDRVKE